MKRLAAFAVLALLVVASGSALAQTENRVEVGAFAEYYRFDTNTISPVNFVGAGGRLGFHINPWASIEGEVGYDFERNQTTFFDNGVTTSFVTTRTRPLHGLFGPKFNFGTGSTDIFATGKVGFVNFASSDQSVAQAFGNVDAGNTRFAVYPGVGLEGYWGHFGMRAEVGDEIYFSGGARNNLRVTFGPQLRF
jgi:opacity protein-like surface antigen